MESICQVCQQKLKDTQGRPEGRHVDFFSCPQCGEYFASKSVLSVLPAKLESEKNAAAKISNMLRQSYEYSQIPTLYTGTIDEILKRKLPNPREQADLFIRWLGKTIDGPGETIDVKSVTHKSIIGAKSDEGFALIVKHLLDSGLLNGFTSDTMGGGNGIRFYYSKNLSF